MYIYIGYQVSLVVSGSSSRSDDRGFESRADHWGTFEKPSLVGSSHGYQRFMQCRFSSARGGFGLLVPSARAVICSAKLLRSYLLIDSIKRYIHVNKLILCFMQEHSIFSSLLTKILGTIVV